MDPRIAAAIERVTQLTPVSWMPVERGYTAAKRGLVSLSDGRRVFVKVGTEELSIEWLRSEHEAYLVVDREFHPEFVGWDDDGDLPVLVLEDVSDGFTVPPWTVETVAAVRGLLERLGTAPAPPGWPRLTDYGLHETGWPAVAGDPMPFLALGVCSETWLDAHLAALTHAGAELDLDGESLVHFDVRSDNLCFSEGRALLVDWNSSCAGHPLVDLAGWLPSLALEGGPKPHEVFPVHPDTAGLASLMAGFFAARAGLPPPPTAHP